MKLFRSALALVLAYALGVQPAVAQMQARIAVQSISGAAAVSAPGAAAGTISLQTLALTPSSSLSPALLAPAVIGAPSVLAPKSALEPAAPALAAAASIPQALASMPAAAAAPAATPAERLTQIRVVADKAVEGLDRASGGEARGKADAQFSALTNEPFAAAAHGVEAPHSLRYAPSRAYLIKPEAFEPGEQKADVPAPKAPKTGFFQIFRDPERNKAFWRYVKGYSVFLLGFEMYMVGQPYLISSITANALHEKHDARADNKAAMTELIRRNRSLSRIAHWVAQFFSYAAIPLFSRNHETDGPKKWLVRSFLIRGAVLAGVPLLFFSTGLLGVTGAMWLFFGLVAAQSFFQGVSVTAEGRATTRLLGDKSVTTDERTRANSVLTIVGSVIAIIGPAIAGQIALIKNLKGKTGVGGAVIYGIYAGALALTGLIYSGIKMFGGPAKKDPGAPAAATVAPAPKGFGGTVKGLWLAIRDGVRIVMKDRLLRTMLLMSMISSLFSDPLVFNVLPEYVENLVAKNPGTLGAIMNVPGLGFFLKSLTSTPMGNFALMIAMASIGSIIAALTIKPLTKLFQKFGFKTDEALTIPFYLLAALEAPLFFLMIHVPTMLGAVALYGLQSLVVGYIGISISGLYQKNLGDQKDEDVNKILAADSLVGIAAAIVSTFVYGFILKDIPIATSLIIAAVATAVVSAIRVAAPFLSFTKDQRKPPVAPAIPAFAPPAHAMPSTGDHNGPNSILSTHL
jgi:energy-converting hydrogenase Eha subunit E